MQGTLDRAATEVEEIAVPLTESMQQMQGALLELIDACLFDLRRANPTVGVAAILPHTAPCR